MPDKNVENEVGQYDAENNQAYYQLDKSNLSRAEANPEGWQNTGTGAEAAVGTQYSWQQQGTQKANTQYQIDKNAVDANALQNQQQINTNAVNYQVQSDMQQYQSNQEADKVGWAGGYVLDQNRQNEYLKQSIQAQMYGAMELQKYGYDSSLAAARLSYDLNMQQYAQEYYQQAVQNALNEAQITGTYFSAEVRDMLAQMGAANEIMKTESPDSDAYKKAEALQSTLKNWFQENKISEAGVKTASQIAQENAENLQWYEAMLTQYNAAQSVLTQKYGDNTDLYIMLDSNGNPMFDGVNIQTVNWDSIKGEDFAEYINSSEHAKQQAYSYMDRQLKNEWANEFTQYIKSTYGSDEQGNIDWAGVDAVNEFGDYIGKNNPIATFLQKKFDDVDDPTVQEEMAKAFDGYTFEMNFGGQTVVYRLNVQIGGEVVGSQNQGSGGSGEDNNNSTNRALIKDYKEGQENQMMNVLFADGNKAYEALMDLSEYTDMIKNNGSWMEDNGWWNGLIQAGWFNIITPGAPETISTATEAIGSWATFSSNKEKAKALDQVLSNIEDSIGLKNLKLLKNAYDKYEKMSNREKENLSDKQIENYKKLGELLKTYDAVDQAFRYYDRNDSAAGTWEYVEDQWKEVGYRWSHINSMGDALGALGKTVQSAVSTVVNGAVGFWTGLFYTWWQPKEEYRTGRGKQKKKDRLTNGEYK